MKRKNHVMFVVDASRSMLGLKDAPIKQIEKIQNIIKQTDDVHHVDTLFSVYLFGTNVVCGQFETKDFEVTYADYEDFMGTYGNATRLHQTVADALQDSSKIYTKYGDHAFLIYVITDGGENCGGRYSTCLSWLTDKHTVVYLVPSALDKSQLISAGVPAGNIDIWNTTKEGLEEAAERFTNSYQTYNVLRSQGVSSTSNYFQVNLTATTPTAVKKSGAKKLSNKDYVTLQNTTTKAVPIKYLVESVNGIPYKIGHAYYALVKKETIQPQKELIIVNKKTNNAFSGREVRQFLNLPEYEIKVQPGDFADWEIYVQSTSVNRNIIPNQFVLVLK